uniref:Uncharacterized protein n=1 Tax=Photinus pyralis TaxID=7054 RepID=A0A1Y1LH00_PHOPY
MSQTGVPNPNTDKLSHDNGYTNSVSFKMAQFKGVFYLAVIFVVIACLMQEVDGRRKILRGRKTITRRYYKSAAIPAWAIILLVSVGELVLGAALFFVMKKFIIDPPLSGTYSPTNISP